MAKAEYKYSFAQSSQLVGQTGCIGYLYGDMSDEANPTSTWMDERAQLKTDEFTIQLSEVVNALRPNGAYSDTLAAARTDSGMDAVRADTEKYSYLLRFTDDPSERPSP